MADPSGGRMEVGPGSDPGDSRARARRLGRVRILAWATASVVGTAVSNSLSGFTLDLPILWLGTAINMVWLATSTRARRPLDLAAMGIVGAGVALFSGATSWTLLLAALVVPARMLAYLLVLDRFAAHLWIVGGGRRFRYLIDFIILTAAIAAGVVIEAGVMMLVAVLDGDVSGPQLLVGLVGRIATMTSLGTIGLLTAERIVFANEPLAELPATLLRQLSRQRMGEYLIMAALTGAAVLASIWIRSSVPTTFLVMLSVLMVATRFSPLLSCSHAFLTWLAIALFAWRGDGPLAVPTASTEGLLVAQTFLMTLGMTALVVSLGRQQRDETIIRLRTSEATAEATAHELGMVMAGLAEGVGLLEQGGRLIRTNPAVDRLLGMRTSRGFNLRDVDEFPLYHPDGTRIRLEDIPHVRVFAGEPEATAVFELDRKDGSPPRTLLVTARRVPTTTPDAPVRAVVMLRDVTAEHRERDALSSFAHVVAHDLRNPLMVIDAWAERLQELVIATPDGPPDTQAVPAGEAALIATRIRSAAARMERFITDLLTYATARDQAPSPTGFSIAEVVDEVRAARGTADGRIPDIVTTADEQVWADRFLVTELLDNLIGNSLKYVAEGVVPRVRVAAVADGDWVSVDVADNGIGIPEPDRGRVFHNFERLRPEYTGTGLGLAICRSIVESHGGTIDVVEPHEDEGTRVRFTLPATVATFHAATPHRSPGGADPTEDGRA